MTLTKNSEQLRRNQLPLELACANTIHGCQGDTLSAVATTIDDAKENHMWSRLMLFTLLTRVQNMRDIYFVGSFSEPALRRLLHQRTYWHAEVDWWLRQRDLLHPACSADPFFDPPPPPFYHPSIAVAPDGLPVVYVIYSTSVQRHYVGYTDCMSNRLRLHRAGLAAKATLNVKDWEAKAYVTGFLPTVNGLQSAKALALEFESRTQKKRYLPHPGFDQILFGLKTVAQEQFANLNLSIMYA